MCAVTVTTVLAGIEMFICDVEATADADATTGNIAHGLGVIPKDVTITELLQVSAAISAWALTGRTNTNLVATKGVGVGSGAAGAQVRICASTPHSIIS